MQLLKNIDDLAYGNLDRDNLAYLNRPDNTFSEYADMWYNIPYPNLKGTERDIQYIQDTQDAYMQKPNWKKYKKFMMLCDSDIKKVIFTRLNEIGVPFTRKQADHLEAIQEELGKMVMMLKSHYQRPRPFQMGYYTGQDIHPFHTISGNSPAYPSGHALQSRFLLKLVAQKYPNFKNKIKKLSDDIAFTRIVLGVHYPSDNLFGFKIADELATLPTIRDKYFGGRGR